MSDGTVESGKVRVPWWRTDDPIVCSGGYGGWSSEPRPQKPSRVVWDGRDVFQLTMPVLLYNDGDSVEPLRRLLEQLANGRPPEIVTVTGDALPIPVQASGRWVIYDLDWSGREVRRKRDKSLTWKLVTITLLEFVAGDTLRSSTRSSRVGGHQVIQHHRVTKADLVGGHGLERIAANELGDRTRWTDIAAVNGLRSSGQLKVGMLLRLP